MSQETPLTQAVDERDHAIGPDDAPVTLLEYGDYECPYCGQAHGIVDEVRAHFGDRLRFVFRHFPIVTSHPHAQHAAEAAEAAAAQGKFWPMHDLLYTHQDTLDDDDLRGFAGQLGLDQEQFDRDLAEHRFTDRVQEEFMGGVRSGVNGTPSFFINGVRLDGSWDRDSLIAAIDAAG